MTHTNLSLAIIQTIATVATVIFAHLRFSEKLVEGIEKSQMTAGPKLFAPALKWLMPIELVVSLSFFGTVFFEPFLSPPPSLLWSAIHGLDVADAWIFMFLCFAVWSGIADFDCGPTKKEMQARARRGTSWIPSEEASRLERLAELQEAQSADVPPPQYMPTASQG